LKVYVLVAGLRSKIQPTSKCVSGQIYGTAVLLPRMILAINGKSSCYQRRKRVLRLGKKFARGLLIAWLKFLWSNVRVESIAARFRREETAVPDRSDPGVTLLLDFCGQAAVSQTLSY
jgi:hypothetical protein